MNDWIVGDIILFKDCVKRICYISDDAVWFSEGTSMRKENEL